MRLFGFEFKVGRAKAASMVSSPGRGWFRILEPFTGAWQKNIECSRETVLAFSAVYACATRIANDISKMPVELVERTDDGIWQVVERQSPFWPVLRKPNPYQNYIQFFRVWLLSKLLNGNAYVLLQRDGRGVVVAMHVLDPARVQVQVTADGRVFYVLSQDSLAGIEEVQVGVPASEIIHDINSPIFHPLCGVSPLYACGMAAAQGIKIQRNSASFFENGSNPGGILSAPNEISDELAEQYAARWREKFSGPNRGMIAVLGNGLKFENISANAEDSQLIEQLRWSVEDVARAFSMPLYKIGAGPVPTSNNVQVLNAQYYHDTLQTLMEDIEVCLDEGLGIGAAVGSGDTARLGTRFDLDVLLRMDTTALVNAEKEAVGAGIKAPNESRLRLNLPPVDGGGSPYLQQQNFSLQALAKRDALADPFGGSTDDPPASEEEIAEALS